MKLRAIPRCPPIPEKAPEMAADSTDRKIEMAATDAVKGDTAPTDPHETFTEPSGEAPSEITSVPEIEPQAGLLTAGEWNDNNNWGFFTNLVNSDRIAFPSFDIDPRFRTAVTVSDKDGKVSMVAMASDEAVKRGAHAGNLIKSIAAAVGGGGGGRPNMAQAGGKNPGGIEKALQQAKTVLDEQIK